MSHPNPSSKFIPTAWLVVILLVPVALLNYLDRQMLASMKLSIMGDIPTIGTNQNWGYMLGQFKWVYAFLSPFAGFMADRYSRRLTICGSLFVWSAVTFWTGHVQTYNELLWARSLMGISEAFYVPAALALISDYHFGHTRSRAIGIHQMGMYFGQIAGGFGGYVAQSPSLGWRTAFDACGIFGMIYAIPLAFILKDAPKLNVQTDDSGNQKKLSPGRALSELFSNLSYILLVLYFTLPALAGWVVRDWMPAILQERYNISQGKAGVSATLYWQVAAVIGAIVGGYLADRWMKKTKRGRIHASAIGMCLIVPAVFGLGNSGSLMVAVLFLILFGLGWGFFDCNNMPILCQIVRPELRATGYGFMNLVSISCGGLADWGFGTLRDKQVPLSMIFGIFACTAIFSVLLVLMIKPRDEVAKA